MSPTQPKATAKGGKASKGKAASKAPKLKGRKAKSAAPARRGSAAVRVPADPAAIQPGDALAPFADLLLPYQVRWLRDRSPMKKWVKSRRVGGTWTQSLEDVLDCVDKPGLKVWFSSSDLGAGKEYLDYVRMWVEVANLLVQTVVVLEDELGNGDVTPEAVEVADPSVATATVVEFHNGSKITVLSSNPGSFRSKGGKVVLDEFAHHKSDRELWKAAQPVAGAWGYDIRILSTLNGKTNAFYRLGNPEFDRPDPDLVDEDGEEEESQPTAWSVHTVPIDQAVAEGMYDRVAKRPTTEKERARYIRRLRRQCLTQEQFDEEFRCIPSDEAHAMLSYAQIESAEREGILGIDQVKGPFYVGMDVGRKKDLSVIYVLEVVGKNLVTRILLEMHRTRFADQKRELWSILNHPRFVRASIDANGIGAQLAEEAQEHFGVYRVEAVVPTSAINDALATRLLQEFEDGTLQIPRNDRQKEGLHALRKTVSATNRARYDAQHDEEVGHADHFWALAHAVSAARTGGQAPADALTLPTATRIGFDSPGWAAYSIAHLSDWAGLR